VSPSKTVWPAPWTLPLCHGGDPAQPSAPPRRSAGGSLAPALSLFFCPNSLQVLHSTFARTSGQRAQREPLLGVQGLPTRSPAGWWSRGWREPNTGTTLGPPKFFTWDLPQAAVVGGPPRHGPLPLPPVLLAGTAGLLDSHVSRRLLPAFGLTLHLTPWHIPTASDLLWGESWVERRPQLWVEVYIGLPHPMPAFKGAVWRFGGWPIPSHLNTQLMGNSGLACNSHLIAIDPLPRWLTEAQGWGSLWSEFFAQR